MSLPGQDSRTGATHRASTNHQLQCSTVHRKIIGFRNIRAITYAMHHVTKPDQAVPDCWNARAQLLVMFISSMLTHASSMQYAMPLLCYMVCPIDMI